MSDKPITNDDIQKQSEIDFHGMDVMGIAQHFAKHTIRELARLMDLKEQVSRQDITNAYSSKVDALNGLGTLTIDLKETTRTLILQKQNGVLDNLTVQIGESFSFKYPANNIPFDCLHLPSLSQTVKLTGTAGDSYVIIQSSIPDLNLSEYFG